MSYNERLVLAALILGKNPGTSVQDLVEYTLILAHRSRVLGINSSLYRRSHVYIYLQSFIVDGLLFLDSRTLTANSVLRFGNCPDRGYTDIAGYLFQELGENGHVLAELMVELASELRQHEDESE
jgi:hypothetical protein